MSSSTSDSIDELNLQILSILQEDARKSSREIAEQLSVATGTIYNRIKKMTEDGIIKGYIPVLDFARMGFDLTALIMVQVEGRQLVNVEEKIAVMPGVTAVYDITGEYDVAVLVRFKTRSELNKLIKSLLKLEHVSRSVTNVVLNVVKEDFRLSLLPKNGPEPET